MKKEYIILTILIILLGGYLLLHKENKDNYTLPEIQKIETEQISKILIQNQNGSIELNKTDGSWTVTDKKYPADGTMVMSMLDTFKGFKLTALVSQSSDLERYELDKANAINVGIFNGTKETFKFTMGKTAPSYNHTFIMLADDKNIYHASGSFRNDFDQSYESYRDKKVFEVKKDSVKKLVIQKDGKNKTFLVPTDQKDKAETIWQHDDGKPADKEKINTLLSSLAMVNCKEYPENINIQELKSNVPACTIKLAAKENLLLSLYPIEGKKEFLGISSMNSYVFKLSQFDSKEIISNIDTILGITQETK